MKNLTAFMLKIETFNSLLEDMVLDTTIEGFVKRSLKASHGWNSMIDNENKTFIFFVDFESKTEMLKMIEELKSVPTETPSILFFDDITEDLLHNSIYNNYKETCETTKMFIRENIEIDFILDKINSTGIDSLLEVEKSVLAA